MKILYAVQASGNGHIARAREIIPCLKKFGAVDIFLSGCNHDLDLDEVRYRSRGLSLHYNKTGGLHYLKTLQQIQPASLLREITSLPVHQYDVVINDFEFITSRACALRRVPSVCFGHHGSFWSDRIPQPEKKRWWGEAVLKYYAPASRYIGLHFAAYDDFIFTPIIKSRIQEATPREDGHITVYLSSVQDDFLMQELAPLEGYRFEIFSRTVRQVVQKGAFKLLPASLDLFTQSMIRSSGVITGGGFETPAEALYLNKKLLVIPIRGQYEQSYNSAALAKMGVPVHDDLQQGLSFRVRAWLQSSPVETVHYPYQIPHILEYLFDTYPFKKGGSRTWLQDTPSPGWEYPGNFAAFPP
ncbi:MAG: glycosyltransferase family protein [Chitinophagaceae bacterium]